MKRLLFFLVALIPMLASAQSLEPYRHNFFTTNPVPILDVVPGSNCYVTPLLVGTDTRRFRIDIPASGAATNVYHIEAGTNVVIVTNGFLYIISVPSFVDGTNGVNGTNGLNGINGTNGVSGTNGAAGAQGPQGVQGIQGIQGIQGVSGTNGVNGSNGTNGLSGTNGLAGLNGTNGLSGTNGATGPQGIQGIQGVAGTNGVNGINGTNGVSDTNIATLNGTNTFTGNNTFTQLLTASGGISTPSFNATTLGVGTLNVTNPVTVSGLTNTSLTPNRMVLTGPNTNEVSAAASGAVPINADGTATTKAQLNTAIGGSVVTNGDTRTINIVGPLQQNGVAVLTNSTGGSANYNGALMTNLVVGMITTYGFSVGFPANGVKFFYVRYTGIASTGGTTTDSSVSMPINTQAPFTLTNFEYAAITLLSTNLVFRLFTNGVASAPLITLLGSTGGTNDTTSSVIIGGTAWTNRISLQISNTSSSILSTIYPVFSAQIVK